MEMGRTVRRWWGHHESDSLALSGMIAGSFLGTKAFWEGGWRFYYSSSTELDYNREVELHGTSFFLLERMTFLFSPAY